jgi:hypothetical protein
MARKTFETANFTQSFKKPGKTNRWVYNCNHCHEKVEHREARLLVHLSDRKTCPGASIEIRTSALAYLAQSRGATEATAPMLTLEVVTPVPAGGNGAEAGQEPPLKKARIAKQSSLNAYVDRPMSSEEKEAADLALLRWVSCIIVLPL